MVPVCAAIEAEIAQLKEAERTDFLKDLGLAEPGLNRVIRAGHELLGLLAGVKEVRAWTVQRGSTAPQAAGYTTLISSTASSVPKSFHTKNSSAAAAKRRRGRQDAA